MIYFSGVPGSGAAEINHFFSDEDVDADVDVDAQSDLFQPSQALGRLK